MTTRREGKRPAGWAAEGSARKMQREETGSSGRMEVEPGAAEKGMPSSEGSSPFETVVGFVTGLLPNHGASSTIDSKLATRSVMMDNPPAGKGTADGPAVDTGSRARGPKLSRRQLRQCGLPKVVHAEGCTFKDFIPLHHLWIKYIDELVGPTGGGTTMGDKLAKADFHGAVLRVTESKCPSLVGLTGIVLQETENTFRLMCQDDQPRTIPKRNSVFTLRHGVSLVTVHGNHIVFRASERARHKFKSQPSVDL